MVDDAYKLPSEKTELMEIFNQYDFRDRLGHPLINCADFLQLVDEYCANGEAGLKMTEQHLKARK